MTTWNAQDYAKNSSVQQTWARELIAKLNLGGDERLLDIGCGDGKVTAELASMLTSGSAVGVDVSREMIGFAKANFPPGDFPNLSFAWMDASELSFENEFDVI